MLIEVIVYTVVCDSCGKDSSDGSDYCGLVDKSLAIDYAMEGNWVNSNDKDYCPDCYEYNDDDELTIKTKL